MTKLDKLYAQMARNPRDVGFEALDVILRRYGFECRQPAKGSSHYIYHHSLIPDLLSIPKARPVKAVYVK